MQLWGLALLIVYLYGVIVEVNMTFAKLDHGIIFSSLWGLDYHVRIVFVTMLALKDENGFVRSSFTGLLRASNVLANELSEALTVLESPDPDSRTPDHEGRRIMKVDGGWLVLNHEQYRTSESEQREKTRLRVKKYREKINDVTDVTLRNVTDPLHSVSVSESVSESVSSLKEGGCKGETKTDFEIAFDNFKIMRKSIKKPLTKMAEELICMKLERLSEGDESVKIKILEQSIEHGWQGVFPLKEFNNGKSYRSIQQVNRARNQYDNVK